MHRLLPLLQLLVLARQLERPALQRAPVGLVRLSQLLLVRERVGAQLGGEQRLVRVGVGVGVRVGVRVGGRRWGCIPPRSPLDLASSSAALRSLESIFSYSFSTLCEGKG